MLDRIFSWAIAHLAAIAVGLVAFFLSFGLAMMTSHVPHREIRIATGAPGGAYHGYGLAYRTELARDDITLTVIETSGTIENLALLHQRRAEVALVQGGITKAADRRDLQSLGTVFYEPLFLFVRNEACAPTCGMPDLLRVISGVVSIGDDESGTQALATAVMRALGVTDETNWRPLPVPVAREALLAGQIDAAFAVQAWEAPGVAALLHDPAIRLMDFPVADALIDVSPSLHHVVLPRGARSVMADLPPRGLDLVAPKASVVVRKDVHPAIQYALLQAMRQTHAKPAMFTKSNEFPAPEAIGLTLSDVAREFYSGQLTWAYRILPFWLADLITVAIATMVPVVIALNPILSQVLKRRRRQMQEGTHAGDTRVGGAAQRPNAS